MRTLENIAAVAESVSEAPSTSIHRRSQQLKIAETSLRRILHKDLGMTPYKIPLVQELKPIDHPMRFCFAKWARDRLREDADFGKKIVFLDEARFDLDGYVNKYVNFRKAEAPKPATVWCGFSSIFLQGVDVRVNGNRYRAMLN